MHTSPSIHAEVVYTERCSHGSDVFHFLGFEKPTIRMVHGSIDDPHLENESTINMLFNFRWLVERLNSLITLCTVSPCQELQHTILTAAKLFRFRFNSSANLRADPAHVRLTSRNLGSCWQFQARGTLMFHNHLPLSPNSSRLVPRNLGYQMLLGNDEGEIGPVLDPISC
jgi:hypothetical protein